jgi:glycerol-3-phosphate dehydrogenase
VIGARVVNKARDGGGDGSTALGGVKAEEVDVYARVVINATGVFTDNVRRLASPDAAETVKGSSGAHVTLPSYFSSTDTGVIIPKVRGRQAQQPNMPAFQKGTREGRGLY